MSPSIGQPKAQDSDTLTGTFAEVMGLARRHDEVQLVRSRRNRAFGATHVGHQAGVDDAGRPDDLVQDDLGIAQRGNRLRGDEGRRLDLGDAGRRERIHQRDLVGRGDEGGLHLEAVARADFLHVDAPAGA
jgi:hypothetical protein